MSFWRRKQRPAASSRPGGNTSAATQQSSYECVLEQARFDDWLQRLRDASEFAIDTETTSIDYMQAELVGISLCLQAGEACYIPLAHRYEDAPRQLDKAAVLAALKPVLEDPAIGKIGQNIKYDAHIFISEGIRMRGLAHDTMLESYVLNSTASRHNMDALAKFYLNKDTIHYEDIAGKGAKQKTFDLIEIETASDTRPKMLISPCSCTRCLVHGYERTTG